MTMNSKISFKKMLLLFLKLTLYLCISNAQAAQDNAFVIYLVRHAEKNTLPPTDLTTCGKQRAEDFIEILRSVDIDEIYSTDVLRSISTAQPIATQRLLKIKIYERSKLEEFSRQLLQQQKNAVVVGHLNTTPMLTGFMSGNNYEMIEGSDYSRIYQVVVVAGQTHVSILHQSFECVESETSL
jgi:2,3-bisphosphoglycerate-dependent phosphoglycerate mutase